VVEGRLSALVRRLPAPAEFIIVLVGCSWFALAGSIVAIVTQSWATRPLVRLTNGNALATVIVELPSLALLCWIGRVRGWKFEAWGLHPSWRLAAAGGALCVATGVVASVAAWLTNLASPGAIHTHTLSELSLPFIALLVAINPVFEEMLEAGYFVQSLGRHGMWVAVLASAAFRAFLHAYQGLSALVTIFPLGLIFALAYWKWRSLWPLFVAHLLFDVYALLANR
jgi:membrane protease YdiL (CAAX protease family)